MSATSVFEMFCLLLIVVYVIGGVVSGMRAVIDEAL